MRFSFRTARHPCHHRSGVSIGQSSLGRHGNGPPFAGAAFLDAGNQIRLGIFLPSVLFCNVLISGAYQLFIHSMADRTLEPYALAFHRGRLTGTA